MKLFCIAAITLLLASNGVFGSNTPIVGLVAVVVLAAIIWSVLPGGRSALTGHSHGGNRSTIARHEAGHVVAANALGGGVEFAEISDHGGRVRPKGCGDPVTSVAFLSAGRYSASTGQGCSGDDSAIRDVLRAVPSHDRARVRREGEALARRTVGSRMGEVRRVARRLDEHGRI